MSNLKKAVGVTAAFVSLPKSEYLLLVMVILGILFGALASIISMQPTIESSFAGALEGLFMLSIPAILTSIIIKLMIRKVPFKRIITVSMVGQIVYGLAYLGYFTLANTLFNKEVLIFVAAALAFLIWLLVARIVFILRWRSFLFAALQTIIYGAFLLTGKTISVSGDPFTITVKFLISSGIMFAFIYFFFLIINAPMKRSFGLNTLDAVSLFLAHWFYESKNIEDEFERVGEEAETVLSSYIFKRKNDVVAFVIPYVHFGPFGSLGGSDFSYLIPHELEKRYNIHSLVFHGTVTHDLNPVASSELEKILSSFDSGLKSCKFSDSKIAFSRGNSVSCFAESLVFDNAAFIGVSRAPETTEDINFGLGLAMMSEAEKQIPIASVVDQHNAETGDITSFEPGSAIGFEYMDSISNSLSKKLKSTKLEVGYSHKQVESPQLGLAGIKVAILSSSPTYAIILLDSNGVSPEMREKLISAAKEIDNSLEVGVYTTDTHTVNRVSGVLNPLHADIAILNAVKQAVSEALKDMQPAQFAAFKNRFKIHVLGAKQSIEIVSTVNAIIAVAKIAAPLLIIGCIIAILWFMSKL
ncbi:DUF2070 family protein [Candidatus Micrarchaeota archaeon]|nr:DUF2070 family protein [Candidatus Micrarchaeota archaeon]